MVFATLYILSGLDSKEPACNAGGPGSIPGSGRSPGEGNGNPLQYSCLENSKDRGALWATVPGVPKSLTHLSDWAATHIGQFQKTKNFQKRTKGEIDGLAQFKSSRASASGMAGSRKRCPEYMVLLFISCSVCSLFLGKSSLRDGPRSNKLTPYLATLRQLF